MFRVGIISENPGCTVKGKALHLGLEALGTGTEEAAVGWLVCRRIYYVLSQRLSVLHGFSQFF